ncbi:HEAT repeat domain-containing protein [Psychrobacter aestuarii]|uniref:Non-specific serine/threonine protein kinase n=1 Tax=Psychrobacter aestuarii TaxID=556327 RepID=A0ABP3FE91_9GAMM|nr:HEAT repeat domain-containing protein [Psychrobacter aestuarii]
MKTSTLPYWGEIISIISQDACLSQYHDKTNTPITKTGRSLFITRLPARDDHDNNDKEKEAASAPDNRLYILDTLGERPSLTTLVLPVAMQCMTANGDEVFLLGVDNHLYQTDWHAKKLQKISTLPIASPSTKDAAQQMVCLTKSVAILYEHTLIICPYMNTAKRLAGTPIIQPLAPLFAKAATDSDTGTSDTQAVSVASSSDGQWLIIGDDKGNVASCQWRYEANNVSQSHIQPSSTHPMHQGRVTALAFAPQSPYFFSAGADAKLYRTHVQGDLQPTDRAKSSGHASHINALCASDTRLFSIGDDGSIKSWALDKGQPSSSKDSVRHARHLVWTTYAEAPALLTVTKDNSLHIIPINTDKNGSLQTVTGLIRDGYARIEDYLSDNSAEREALFYEALAMLEQQNDHRALTIIKTALTSQRADSNRARALIKVLSQLSLKARIGVLEQLLDSPISSRVRRAAFDALQQQYRQQPLASQDYLTQALAGRHDEVVAAAIQQHHIQATRQPHEQSNQSYSQAVLPALLSHNSLTIRRAALIALETIFPETSIQADMLALQSRYTDTVQAGLIRLYQRDFLAAPAVSRQLMLLQHSADAEIRQTAFFVSLMTQPTLISALKNAAHEQDDSYLLRTLSDFDAFCLSEGTITHSGAASDSATNSSSDVRLALQVEDFQTPDEKTGSNGKKPKAAKRIQPTSPDVPMLDDATLAPLLQALSNHQQDISFRAAYALACLQDPRAFGVLIGFAHSDDAVVRAGVARALGNQRLADGQALLAAMLNDDHTQVRKVTMQALGKVCSDTQTWAAFGFASAHAHIHESALALLLQQNLAKMSDTRLVEQFQALLDNRFPSVRLEVLKMLVARLLDGSSDSLYRLLQLIATSQFEDIHRAGLEEWQRFLLQKTRKANAHEDNANDGALLALLLSDPFRAIRSEALETAGDYPQRFNIEQVITAALASPFEDIVTAGLQRCGALTDDKAIAVIMPLLLPLFAAEGLSIRKTALDVALQLVTHGGHISSDKHTSDNYLALLNAGVQSPYADIQLKIATLLARYAQHIDAKDDKNAEQATSYSEQAYAVFERYLQQVMPDKKQDKSAYDTWHAQVIQALIGLTALAAPQAVNAFGWYQHYLNHPDADFSTTAPHVMWVANANDKKDIEALQHWQRDERSLVQQSASIALAVLGNTAGAKLYQQTDTDLSVLHKDLSPITWLQGRAGLGMDTAWALAPLFGTPAYLPAARWTLLFAALSADNQHAGAALLVNALSFVDAQSAILYAHSLARFNADDSTHQSTWAHISSAIGAALQDTLTALLPQNNDPQARQLCHEVLASVNAEQLQQLAALIHAPTSSLSPQIKAKAIQALGQLSLILTKPNLTHVQAWLSSIAQLKTHPAFINKITDTDNTHADATDSYHYQSLAFGTWLGVIRNAAEHSLINQAIRGLLWLAQQSETTNHTPWSASVTQALLPLLNHSRAETRALVWDALHQLPITRDALAQEAMATEHRDMVAAGVKVWVAEHITDSTLTTTLSQRLRDAHPLLAEEIYHYLITAIGQLPASLVVLEYADTPLVRQVINAWQQTGLQDKDAHQQFLQRAIYVHDWQARYHAWQQLLVQPALLDADPQLLEALLTYFMLSHSEYAQQQVLKLITKASQHYAEQQSPTAIAQQTRLNEWLFALLDDPRCRISRVLIYRALASTRSLSVVTGLQARLALSYQDSKHQVERADIVQALIKVSGFDQPIHDYFYEYKDTRWLDTQYPRHPVVLMDVFSQLLRVQDSNYLLELVSPLAWIGRESDDKTATPTDTHIAERIDALLAQAYAQLPEKRRLAVVKAIAYRAQYRHGDTTVLKQALSSRQDMVSFIAAEALAKVGLADGASLLMATMVHHTDGDVRRRSVLAMGSLFDTPEHPDAAPVSTDMLYQAYERLLQYAEDETHYLQDVACEALGMLADGGRFEYSTQIFELLKAQLNQPNLSLYHPAILHWLHGLRRLGTPAAWAEIRQYISKLVIEVTYSTVLQDALYLLSFAGNEGNKALLLKLLANTEQAYIFAATYQAAQKLWGTDKTCQPYDWAAVQNRQQALDNEDMALSLKRITECSSVTAIIDFMLTHGEALPEHIRDALAQRILQDADMTPETLAQLLAHPNDSMLSIALSYLGQHQSAITNQTLSIVAYQLTEAQQAWQALMQRIGSAINDYQSYETLIHTLAKQIALALWLLYRYSAATNANADNHILVTSFTWLTRISQLPIIASLPALSEHVEAWWQQVWLALLARPESGMTELSELLPTLQALPPLRVFTAKTNALRAQVIDRLTPPAVATTAASAPSISQSDLLSWIQTQNTEALYHCASDEAQTISTRLQAIEALGQMFDTRVSAWLDSLMQHTQPDIQKTAYNVKRRWQRGQNKAKNKRPMPYFDTPLAGSNAWQTTHNPQHLSLGGK